LIDDRFAVGTHQIYTASTVDQRPKDLTNALMFGNRFSMAVPDIDRTDFLLIIGANPMVSNGSLVTAPGWPRRLKALQQRGGTVVVVDPHRTRTAVAADQHVAIRPGRDHRNAGESALADRPDSRSAAGLLVV
jgi:anaerobic selenocysteine-containing dehydrogenase